MKKLTIFPMILILFVCFACDTKQKGRSYLSVGRDKLIESGLAIEAVQLLTEAEKKEEDKTEPRALLVIAYSHALASGVTKGQDFESEYKRQRAERIDALNEAEINKMIEILSKRSEVQQNGFQALVEKGTDAAVLLIDNLAEGLYPKAHSNFITTLTKMGSKAVDPILDKIADADVNPNVKIILIRVIGEIGDEKVVERLNAIDMTNISDAFKISIYATLYRLGEKKYKSEILSGLTSNEAGVRRAAAKVMANLENVNTTTLITALKDSDSQVVTDIAKALAVHKNKDAVKPLANILKSEHGASAKKAVVNTLIAYAEAGSGLTKGLAKHLSLMLINKEVSSSEDRVRLLQLLKHPVMVKKLKAAIVVDDLDAKLYDYLQTDEESAFVKVELNELLNLIRK